MEPWIAKKIGKQFRAAFIARLLLEKLFQELLDIWSQQRIVSVKQPFYEVDQLLRSDICDTGSGFNMTVGHALTKADYQRIRNSCMHPFPDKVDRFEH